MPYAIVGDNGEKTLLNADKRRADVNTDQNRCIDGNKNQKRM